MMAKKGAPLLSNNLPPSVMNRPGQFNFLKVPNNEDDQTSPSCGDGTELSFQFKQGTDANLKSSG
eukprot:12796108-Ditylum_brightwellii.AAC.1